MTETKMISHKKAEERFAARLLPDNHGHRISVHWNGKQLEHTNPKRDKFDLVCSRCTANVNRWEMYVNADGTIGVGNITEANSHIISRTPAEIVTTEAYVVMTVEMKRGADKEFWVTHKQDTDFLEAINQTKHNYWISDTFPWTSWIKNSRGKWQVVGRYSTELEAVGSCTAFELGYKSRGYACTIHVTDSDVGVTPPSATVAISVRRLIDEYKSLRSGATPLEIKPWLDKVREALVQLELLESLADEVEERFAKSMIL
jgi:hypothetical protein